MGGGITVIQEIWVGGGGQKTLPSVGGGGGVDFFWNNPMSHTQINKCFVIGGCISYVKSRAMALNLVEYKSPVQNVIAYARIACLLYKLDVSYARSTYIFKSDRCNFIKPLYNSDKGSGTEIKKTILTVNV